MIKRVILEAFFEFYVTIYEHPILSGYTDELDRKKMRLP